jgi:hypothetical protein
LWYNQSSNYNYDKPEFSSNTGSFTQIVWKSTTSIGFGLALGIKNNMKCAFVVANYSPPGNLIGAFNQNVIKP